MTVLATQNNRAGFPAALSNSSLGTAPAMRLDELYWLAEQVAGSGLFGVKTQQEAMTLFMIAQAEGRHPIEAMRRYHLMTLGGKTVPTMRSDAMQADFQALGGQIEVIERTAKRAAAWFSHPTMQPTPVEFSYTMEDATLAGDATKNPLYKSRPKAMLWARLVTSAITSIAPGIKVGILSVEEAQDIAANETPFARHADSKREAIEVVQAADVPIPGQPEGEVDTRPYHLAAKAAAEKVSQPFAELHKHLSLRAIQTDHADGPVPSGTREAIKMLTKVYEHDRAWVRSEITSWCETRHELTTAEPPEEGLKLEYGTKPPDTPAADLGWVHGDTPAREPGSD